MTPGSRRRRTSARPAILVLVDVLVVAMLMMWQGTVGGIEERTAGGRAGLGNVACAVTLSMRRLAEWMSLRYGCVLLVAVLFVHRR